MSQNKSFFSKAAAFIIALIMMLGIMSAIPVRAGDVPFADMLDLDFSDEVIEPVDDYTAPLTRIYESNINGDGTVTVTVNFKNNSTVNSGKAVASLEMLGDAFIIGGQNETVVTVAPGATETVSWTAKAIKGSARLIALSTVNGVTAEERVGKVASKGAGWISGDTHDHSRYSDGSGTIAQNFAVAKTAGMDFINISDHDNSRGWADAQLEGAKNDILPIWGNEYSGNGHAVFMNVDREFNYNGGRLPKAAVDLLKEHTDGRGLAYAAHPYDGTVSADPWGRNDSWSAAIDGIEVWNGWYASNYWANKQAREQWDKMNSDGRHLYGIADTDTHSADGMGAVYTTVFVDEYNIDGIIDAYQAGHMYGSNGPVIDIKIEKAMMGDDLEIPAEGKNVVIELSGYYICDLAKVLLIKNGETIYTKDINTKSFAETAEVFVKPGDFIRMEVEGFETAAKKLTTGSYSTHSFFTSAPFAFSNPIFFVEGEEKIPETYTVTFDPNGGRINVNGVPTTSDPVSVTVTEGEKVARLYVTRPDSATYSELGWYLGDDLFDFNTPVTEDITLKIKWLRAPIAAPGHISWLKAGNAITLDNSRNDAIGGADMTYQIYPNDGFFDPYLDYSGPIEITGFRPGSPNGSVKSNAVTLFTKTLKDGKSIQLNFNYYELCTVTFDSDGGNAVDSIDVCSNYKIGDAPTASTAPNAPRSQKPADPQKDGYEFLGWYLDGEAFDFEALITEDITLGAQWEKITPPVTLVSAVATAYVTKLNGNQNDLTITVTETYSDGSANDIAVTLKIKNNAADYYSVGDYTVYVDTKGNDQIRACYIV